MRSNASLLHLNPHTLGLVNAGSTTTSAVNQANELLQQNHDNHHIFWNEGGLHNHLAHALLTLYALGAGPSELQQAFDDGKAIQRPQPSLSDGGGSSLADPKSFREALGKPQHYQDFLDFFHDIVDKQGWKKVVSQYCFDFDNGAEDLFVRLYAGGFHPLIHLGFGVEFRQSAIIAEALAQCAISDEGMGATFLRDAERLSNAENASRHSVPLSNLVDAVHANQTIRESAHWTDGNKMRDGVFARAGSEIKDLAAQYHADPETLEQRQAEMINACAYFSGAAQRNDKSPKIDFFYMHDMTSSIFLTVFLTQDWIDEAVKVRLLEWKSRLDLAWYASRGAPALHADFISDYKPTASANMGWADLYSAVNAMYDDGHVAKYIRALKNGEEVCSPFENQAGIDGFPIKGQMWLQLARMAYDSTNNLSAEQGEPKWVTNTGFEQAWEKVPAARL